MDNNAFAFMLMFSPIIHSFFLGLVLYIPCLIHLSTSLLEKGVERETEGSYLSKSMRIGGFVNVAWGP